VVAVAVITGLVIMVRKCTTLPKFAPVRKKSWPNGEVTNQLMMRRAQITKRWRKKTC